MLANLLSFLTAYYATLYRARRMTTEQRQQLQHSRLNRLLATVQERNAFYRQRIDQTQAQLLAFPTVTKHDFLKDTPEHYITAGYTAATLQTEKSTGTSGNPFTVYFDPDYVRDRNLRFLRGLYATGYRWPMKMLLITGDRDRKSSPGRRWYYTSLKATVDDWYALLQEVKPDVVYGCTTPLRLLALHIKNKGLTSHRPDIIITTAETLDADTRELLADTFKAEIFDFYGMTEMGLVAWECTAHDGYHLAEDAILIERLPLPSSSDDTEACSVPLRSSEKPPFRLVFTNLMLTAMPFIRYESGDIAEGYNEAPCLCGSHLPRIRRFEGRLIDSIRLPDGQLISPYRFTCTLEEIPGMKRFRVIQRQVDQLLIEIECPDQEDAADRLKQQALATVRRIVPDTVRVDAVLLDSIPLAPGRKFRPVECRIGQPTP